ncbi:uncharacterized protein LOC129792164 [Lutzomyia longipalpis]|uniref:uncharacterized protein LOC129792164 n=2 Tax=Lutzomyia longipalpis TaxID=7200 RepID=UPI002483C749|nr:uncharacterized protein LOC129792164 [Lutzomyia longipalpis]
MCQNCLSDTHATTDCSYSLCKQCNQKHNTLLHEAFGSPLPSGSQSTGVDSSTGTVCCANVMGDSSLHVLLATAQVKLLDDDNNEHSCRVLLDAGSQFNFITTHWVQRLRLKMNPAEFIIKGIGSVTQISKHRTDVRLRLNQDVSEIGCAVVKKITGNLPNCFIDRESFTIPDSIQLADPDWHRNQPVDMLIGGEFFWHFLKDQTITLGPNAPLLKDSVFGWLVVGPHFNKPTVNSKSIGQCNVATSMASMEATMQKFWKVEEVPKRQEKISEQDEAEKIFQSTTTRTEDGRYMVTLPFTEEIKELGNNRSSATHQFLQLERRLDRNSDLKAEYTKVIHEYLSLNIIEEVPACELDRPSYYLPHHAVVKLHAISTKLRIVFNGSAISQTGRSLNHCLRIGPVVQPPLVEILWRFRIHQFALTCDVVKMYLQILMCPEHRDYVRFMWRDHKTGDIRHFRFRTVCFGLASSPFLATRTLIQLAEEEGHLFPLAAKAIRECFYVDDCLVSLPSISDLILLREELIQLLGRAQFQLAKFKSNCPSETDDNGDSQSHDLADDTVKTLGLIWNSTSDTFQFNLSDSIPTENVTKRQMLSAIAKIYDPIGLIGPIISHAKLMMQEVWLLKVDWDTPVPSDLQHKWSTFIKDLPSIESLRIPRWISSIASPTHVELHAFADASSVAYGAVIFYVSEDANGHKSSRLLTSKSKVVPLKDKETEDPAITIPKAELCAAKMAAELMSSVSEALGVTQCFYWTDAAVVLYQIHTPSEKREIFVRNRVRDILKLTKAEEWRHVASADNPADPLSRGCLASQAVTNTLWWSGPEWLVQGSDHWPAAFDPKTFSMGRKPAVALTSTNAMSPAHDTNDSLHSILHMRISTFTRMQRVLAWVIRAKNIFKVRKGRVTRSTQENMITGPLTVDELQQAETFLVKREQEQHFAAILTAVRNGSLDHTSHFKFIRRLRPFIDSEGILRVGGRLSNSCESYDVQHPIILPKGRLSLLIARHFHLTMLHAGPQALLSSLRQRFWPIDGRRLTRHVVYHCVRCFKVKPRVQEQLMGDLPEHRASKLAAFTATGMDFAGPVLLKTGIRKGTTTKAYILVLVCMSTKAIHLELVSSLTTNAFIAALRRFTSRRGAPKYIYSDNAKTFVGADRELKELLASTEYTDDVGNFMSGKGIQWRFQPPRAPHHGGLWEAGVKSCKYHLKRIVGATPLNFEEMTTVLTQIESVLNSRPLVQLPTSSDMPDLTYLTPGHFLGLEGAAQLPDPTLEHLSSNRVSRWQLCQKLQQDFSKRWKEEYLTTLQVRTKWSKECVNLQVEDVVLLYADHLPSPGWLLGVVMEIFPGKDNRVRVVLVRTSKGTFKRPITKVVKLPIEDEQFPAEDVAA